MIVLNVVEDATEAQVEAFIAEHCEVSPTATVSAQALREAFAGFCNARADCPDPV